MTAAAAVKRLLGRSTSTASLLNQLDHAQRACDHRVRVLRREIAEREAELADVRRARDATMVALLELGVSEVLADG